jgi:heat shock protein HslJ
MGHEKGFSLTRLIFTFIIASVGFASGAQQTRAQSSWLDRRLSNWNRQSGNFPQLPRPPASRGESTNSRRCRQEVREPANAAERALVRRGWSLYGPVYSYGMTRIVTALSSFDGMCRPLGFQAFVYLEGRYAGTLSPAPMDSRSDGSLTDVHVNSATRISADFARYRDADPLCCPSRISSVVYNFPANDRPTISPRNVAHRPAGETTETDPPGSGDETASLFGKRWTLIQMERRRLSAGRAYVEFSGEQRRVSGSGGCNSFAATFDVDGSMLRLSPIASTKRACLDTELQRIETEFLRLLGTTTRFEVQGDTLRLYADDRLALAFVNR